MSIQLALKLSSFVEYIATLHKISYNILKEVVVMKKIKTLKLLNKKKKRLDTLVLTKNMQSKVIKKLSKEIEYLQNKLMK